MIEPWPNAAPESSANKASSAVAGAVAQAFRFRRRTSRRRADRLQKVLAAAGIASRRECEELILDGRVEVDRQVVTELGTRVDPQKQEIRVDGEVVATSQARVLRRQQAGRRRLARRAIPSGRPRVIDLLPPDAPRVFCVGRLDMSSEGLILVTNDGELANGLTHPRHGVEKIYHVQVAGQRRRRRAQTASQGHAPGRRLRPREARPRQEPPEEQSTILEMVLDEGRNREIRRLLARVGHKVQRLTRIAVGPVRLGDLPPGAVRPLTQARSRRPPPGRSPPAARKTTPPQIGSNASRSRATQGQAAGQEADESPVAVIGGRAARQNDPSSAG